MKQKCFFLQVLLIAVIAFNSCQKADPGYTRSPGAFVPPADADGAFYAQRDSNQFEWGVEGFTGYSTAYAWLEDINNTASVNGLFVNNTLMRDTLGSGDKLIWYTSMEDISGFSNPKVKWVVGGNSGLGIPMFTKIDSTTFPEISWGPLPLLIQSNKWPAIHFTPLDTGIAQIICSIYSASGDERHAVFKGTDTTIDLNRMRVTGLIGDLVRVQLLAVKYTTEIIGGKKYYFVKQSSYLRYTHPN